VRYGSLFSGIGGLDLALEAFGHTPAWQAESDPYARAVLARHWPGVHCYEDVRQIDAEAPPVDIVCGGFPCQDISNAGKRAGIGGERSGLWSEFARIIRVLRPRFVFVENVAALTVRGLDRVLGDLASLGFDAEWDVFRAADVGAPHLRARIFILSYANGEHGGIQPGRWNGTGRADSTVAADDGEAESLANSGQVGLRTGIVDLCPGQSDVDGGGQVVPDADRAGLSGIGRPRQVVGEAGIEDAPGNVTDGRCGSTELADACGAGWGSEARNASGRQRAEETRQGKAKPGGRGRSVQRWGYWDIEPDVGRVVARIPAGVDARGTGIGKGSRGVGGGRDRANRLRCLGNAVVWQQAALALEILSARIARSSTPTTAREQVA